MDFLAFLVVVGIIVFVWIALQNSRSTSSPKKVEESPATSINPPASSPEKTEKEAVSAINPSTPSAPEETALHPHPAEATQASLPDKPVTAPEVQQESLSDKERRALRDLEIVRQHTYRKKSVCNNIERAAYIAAVSVIGSRKQNERVLVQVNLGEMLKHPKSYVHQAINGKRVDLLITTDFFDPLVAFEIDGSGHSRTILGETYDKIKDHSLKSAGIQLFRIDASDDNAEKVKEQVRSLLRQFFGMDRNDSGGRYPHSH